MPLAHLDRASDYELDGDRFESYMARQIKGSIYLCISGMVELVVSERMKS